MQPAPLLLLPSVRFCLRGDTATSREWTLPVWFYVSVTGVIVCLPVCQIYASKSG